MYGYIEISEAVPHILEIFPVGLCTGRLGSEVRAVGRERFTD